jgi:hypothetical protein
MMLHRLPRRMARPAVTVTAVVGLGIGLAACGDSGQSLARQACTHVDKSISLLEQSSRASNSDPLRASAMEAQAEAQLRTALPIAAEAAYDDGQWQALMTTLSESNRVSPATLMPALSQQCATAQSSPFNQPAAPSSIPPPAPFTTSK